MPHQVFEGSKRQSYFLIREIIDSASLVPRSQGIAFLRQYNKYRPGKSHGVDSFGKLDRAGDCVLRAVGSLYEPPDRFTHRARRHRLSQIGQLTSLRSKQHG